MVISIYAFYGCRIVNWQQHIANRQPKHMSVLYTLVLNHIWIEGFMYKLGPTWQGVGRQCKQTTSMNKFGPVSGAGALLNTIVEIIHH